MMVVKDALGAAAATGRVLLVCACGAYEEEEEEEEERDDDDDDAKKKKKKIGLVTNSGKSCWSAIRARRGRGGEGNDDDDDDDDDDAIVESNGEPCVRFSAKKSSEDATSASASGGVFGVVGIRAVGFASSRKHYHCATSWSEKREFLLSGWNQFGQLGDGSCQSRAPSDFRPVPLFERMRIRVRKVALGLFHSVALCEGGSVYGFGANPQIGAPKEVKYSTVPRLIEGGDLRDDDDDDEIEFIGCGSRHTLVASKRRAFAFGCNAKRQCGFAPPEDANDDEEEEQDDEEEQHNVYLPRETLSTTSAREMTTIVFVRCERWSSFVGVVQQ
jgi:hypothetical protein